MIDFDNILICELIRIEEFKKGTIGIFLIDGQVFCTTLEPPWINNKPFYSCIPTGFYLCKRVQSDLVGKLTKGKWSETFEVTAVDGRTLIRFHQGSYPRNTDGCILTGRNAVVLRDERRIIVNTGNTFNMFMAEMEDVDEFLLHITLHRSIAC